MSSTDRAAHTVLVVDDHPLFRKGLTQLIDMEADFHLLGEASSAAEGISQAERLLPSLILLDVKMQGMSGLDSISTLRSLCPNARIAVITVSDDPADVVTAMRLGADGYLLKDMDPERMLDGLRAIVDGKTILTENLTEKLVRGLRPGEAPPAAETAALTQREQEILDCIGTGMSNREIARSLYITEGTVKVHVKHLLKKLNVRSKLEAAVWAVENRHSR